MLKTIVRAQLGFLKTTFRLPILAPVSCTMICRNTYRRHISWRGCHGNRDNTGTENSSCCSTHFYRNAFCSRCLKYMHKWNLKNASSHFFLIFGYKHLITSYWFIQRNKGNYLMADWKATHGVCIRWQDWALFLWHRRMRDGFCRNKHSDHILRDNQPLQKEIDL